VSLRTIAAIATNKITPKSEDAVTAADTKLLETEAFENVAAKAKTIANVIAISMTEISISLPVALASPAI